MKSKINSLFGMLISRQFSIFTFSVLFFSLLTLNSCKKDEPELPSGNVKEVKFKNVSSYTDWHYFSFSKGEFVEVGDFQNDLSWDIAFHRGDIRLNGGASGKGKAEGLNTNKTKWEDVTSAPATGYKKDEIGEITIAFTGAGTDVEEQPFSQVLSTWLTVDTSNPPPKYILHNWVYVLKTADGKFVKLWIYDNRDERNVSTGYISFKYQYNESGSVNFE